MNCYLHDESTRREHPNGAVSFHTSPPFSSLARVENCPCEDNVRRLVYIIGEPETFFSVPACVRVKGKVVSGFVTSHSGVDAHGIDPTKEGLVFVAKRSGRNAGLIANAPALTRALLEGQ